VLFFYIGTPSPILETELELIKIHEQAGDKVRVLQCSGALPNCHWNIKHIDSKCAMCRSKFKSGWDVLNPSDNVELKQFERQEKYNDIDLQEPFDSIKDITSFEYDGEGIGYGTTATMVSVERDHRLDTHKFHEDIIRTLTSSIHIYNSLKIEMKNFCPDRVYFFNGRIHTHLPAKLLCNKLGIDFYSYEVSYNNNSYVLINNKTVHDPISSERVAQIDGTWTSKKQELGDSILQNMRNRVTGKLPTFANNQKPILPDGFDIAKRNIAIFSGTLDEYEGIQFGTNKIYKPDQTAGIAEILGALEFHPEFFFYLRVHPHMKGLPRTNSQLADIKSISTQFSNVCVIWPEDPVDSYGLIDACEKIVSFGSTTGVEATFWGRPSILADYSLFQNFNYAYQPASHSELIDLLHADIPALSKNVASKTMFSVVYDHHIKYKFFKEEGIQNNLAFGAFDGVRLKSSRFSTLWFWCYNFLPRLIRVIKNPNVLLKKIR